MLTEKQIQNILEFLSRAPLKGSEASALIECQITLSRIYSEMRQAAAGAARDVPE